MTAPLDAATKRLRGLSPGQLADEVGAAKAAIADANEVIEALKGEAVRRGITEANGTLFRITLSPPSEQQRIDSKLLEAEMGRDFIDRFSKTINIDWQMRCSARIASAAAARRVA